MDLSSLDVQSLEVLLERWGYAVIFAGMLLENAGLPLPGEANTLLGGYVAGSGHLSPWGVVAAAASGAVVGDNLGYWVGRRYGLTLLLQAGRLLGKTADDVEQLRMRFLRRAELSVVLGRFVALLRVLAGPMAGAVAMPYRRFVLCNLTGALLWASTMVSLAWLCGRWVPLSTLLNGVVEFGLVLLVLVLLVLVLPRLINQISQRAQGRNRLL
ncbi:MAG: DedA family protein [Cyanobacteria bacterium K_DeepCast_35m_m2_023]|nr:DedA family protein [Cyanobacteria bacterium K_DeepCast_35m_m2_023]